MYVCMYECINECMYACMYVCLYAYPALFDAAFLTLGGVDGTDDSFELFLGLISCSAALSFAPKSLAAFARETFFGFEAID